jgi:hypothetical protein
MSENQQADMIGFITLKTPDDMKINNMFFGCCRSGEWKKIRDCTG